MADNDITSIKGGTNATRSGRVTNDPRPTLEPGNYDDYPGIFGGPLPQTTGAGGTTGNPDRGDITTERGQLDDGLTGLPTSVITETGAPGTPTSPASAGGTTITYTRPDWNSGPMVTETASDAIGGPQDSTMANGQGYATGGPQLPGIKGNEPQAGDGRYQPSSGHVLRGGRAVR